MPISAPEPASLPAPLPGPAPASQRPASQRPASQRPASSGPASPALERFARETLGCGCGPEVFALVEVDHSSLPGLTGAVRRIRIGGRLLIYLIEPCAPREALSGLADWVALGRAERDRLGMNRLRLALVLGRDLPLAASVEAAFLGSPGRDERIHLHLLERLPVDL